MEHTKKVCVITRVASCTPDIEPKAYSGYIQCLAGEAMVNAVVVLGTP